MSVVGNTLTIRAERRDEREIRDEQFQRRELVYGVFQRSIELPPTVDVNNPKPTYKSGVLEIALPKKEDAKPKQIKVQAEDESAGSRQEGARAGAESAANRGSERDRRMTQ